MSTVFWLGRLAARMQIKTAMASAAGNLPSAWTGVANQPSSGPPSAAGNLPSAWTGVANQPSSGPQTLAERGVPDASAPTPQARLAAMYDAKVPRYNFANQEYQEAPRGLTPAQIIAQGSPRAPMSRPPQRDRMALPLTAATVASVGEGALAAHRSGQSAVSNFLKKIPGVAPVGRTAAQTVDYARYLAGLQKVKGAIPLTLKTVARASPIGFGLDAFSTGMDINEHGWDGAGKHTGQNVWNAVTGKYGWRDGAGTLLGQVLSPINNVQYILSQGHNLVNETAGAGKAWGDLAYNGVRDWWRGPVPSRGRSQDLRN